MKDYQTINIEGVSFDTWKEVIKHPFTTEIKHFIRETGEGIAFFCRSLKEFDQFKETLAGEIRTGTYGY